MTPKKPQLVPAPLPAAADSHTPQAIWRDADGVYRDGYSPAFSSVVAPEGQAPAPSNRSPYHVARFGPVSIRFNTETEAFDVVNGDVVLPITAVKVTLA